MSLTIVVFTLILITISLILDRWKPSVVFALGTLIILLSGVVSGKDLLGAFANESIVSIFLLVILSSAINDNFDVIGLLDKMFTRVKTTRGFLVRLSLTVAPLSAFVNNTPIVVMMIPYVYQWGKRNHVAPSKLLMPLSFITILGGMITVIGTSTNMVLNGFIEAKNDTPLGFGDYLIPGVLVSVVGIIFLLTAGYRMLPDRGDIASEVTGNLKEYLVETEVVREDGLVGRSVNEAGLRNLEGIFLVEIVRGERVISPIDPNEIIHRGDKLFFAGETEKVVDLINKDNGLEFPKKAEYRLGKGLQFIETVIPSNSEFVGKSLKEVRFREHYDAAVIAIHRNGEKLRGKIGEIILDKGDMLLVTAGKSFLDKMMGQKNLYLVSVIRKMRDLPPLTARLFWLLVLSVIGIGIAGFFSLFTTLLLLLALSAAFGFTGFAHAKKNISLDLFLILGCAVTFSNALISTGGAEKISALVLEAPVTIPPFMLLLILYVVTVILTSFITNAATVAILFPLAYSFIHSGLVPETAAYLTIAFGASCCFFTPFGYQTNLMVYGPGNYKFGDFIRLGLPLALLYSVTTLAWIYFRFI